MNVENLIAELNRVENKELDVVIYLNGERYPISMVDTNVEGVVEINIEEYSREKAIRELTKYELQYLMSNQRNIELAADFFINGGYENYNDADLEAQYRVKILKTDFYK